MKIDTSAIEEGSKNAPIVLREFKNPDDLVLAVMYGFKVNNDRVKEFSNDSRFAKLEGDLYFYDFKPFVKSELYEILRCTYDVNWMSNHLIDIMKNERIDSECVDKSKVVVAMVWIPVGNKAHE